MAVLPLGTIAIADNGTVTLTAGSETETLWNLLEADAVAAAAQHPYSAVLPIGPSSVPRKLAQKRIVVTLCTYIRTLLLSRATAEITTSATGLQRMPASTVENTECKAPSVAKYLSIV